MACVDGCKRLRSELTDISSTTISLEAEGQAETGGPPALALLPKESGAEVSPRPPMNPICEGDPAIVIMGIEAGTWCKLGVTAMDREEGATKFVLTLWLLLAVDARLSVQGTLKVEDLPRCITYREKKEWPICLYDCRLWK